MQSVEFGGHIDLNCSWGYSIFNRMDFVRRKTTTAKSKFFQGKSFSAKINSLSDVVGIVQMEEIPPPLIINWDQTGLKIVPSSQWTMHEKGAKRVEAVGVSDSV